ncbi:MAG: hypothetical protein ACKO96_47900 [Flammeovirgaceae bacterium]
MSKAFGHYWEQSFAFLWAGSIFHGAVTECLKNASVGSSALGLPMLNGGLAARVSKHFGHMMAVSAVDNFNSFLSELVLEVLEKDPRPLSGKQFPVKAILEHNDINELKRSVVEKFIVDLGYQNINDLSEFLSKNFGIKSLNGSLTRLRLSRLIQIRNVITHNRGVVNGVFLNRSQSKRDKLEDLVWVPHPVRLSGYLTGLVRAIDDEATTKFQLEESDWKVAWDVKINA